MRSVWAVLLSLLMLYPGRLLAQRWAEPASSTVLPSIDQLTIDQLTPDRSAREVGSARLVVGGLLGGVAVGLGGAWSGARITRHECEDCEIVGAAYGGVAGVSAGVPLGVHLANGGRGDLLKSVVASLAIGGIGLGVAHLTHEEGVMFGVPVLQLVSSIAIERRSGR